LSAPAIPCAGNYRLIALTAAHPAFDVRPAYEIEITVRSFTGPNAVGCLAKGKHRFGWDPAALTLTER